jgi:hypothetical protein
MSIYNINSRSTEEEITDFYNLYVESYRNLCMYKGIQIINLSEYIPFTTNIQKFIEDIHFITTALGFIIYYSHNDDVITCIACITVENISNCYITINYLCGNIETKDIKINGKSQGNNMLDFIFQTYDNYVILIEPANVELISYYTKYKQPGFPFNSENYKETNFFLIYGNLTRLNEICFEKIFNSIKNIKKLEKDLGYVSLDELYSGTNDLASLKYKLREKLLSKFEEKKIDMSKLRQLNQLIINLKYYDIDEIIITSSINQRQTNQQRLIGGKRRKSRNKKSIKHKKSRKMNRKMNRKNK